MEVPFIDLKRFEDGFLERWLEKVEKLSFSAQFMGGSEVVKFEDSIKTLVGVDYAISCANGTDALQLSLRALGVGEGDVVFVPNMTFWATFEAVVNVGARPSVIDISLVDGGIDLNILKDAIVRNPPKAVIIAHLYGWGATNLRDIRELCRSNGIPLLEDGAQCFGVLFEGRPIYSEALISTTSFYPAKVLGGAGDGGAVFTSDSNLAARVRYLANHGRSSHYGHGDVGWNSRLDSLQAGFLNITLDYIDNRIISRQKSAQYYRDHIRSENILILDPPSGYSENGYCNVCLIKNMDTKLKLQNFMKEHSISFGNIYPGAISSQEGAHKYLYETYGDENSRLFASSVFNLPLFSYMQQKELEYVANKVNEFFEKVI